MACDAEDILALQKLIITCPCRGTHRSNSPPVYSRLSEKPVLPNSQWWLDGPSITL